MTIRATQFKRLSLYAHPPVAPSLGCDFSFLKRRFRRRVGILAGLPVLFVGWVAILLGVGVVSDAAPAFVVLFPDAEFTTALDSDFAILSASHYTMTLSSEQPWEALRLYRAGAWLVLPAGLAGCLPMPNMPDMPEHS